MDEFNFYNSENDGYRGGFGGYVDPEPVMPNTPFSTGGMRPPKKKRGAARIVALVSIYVGMKTAGVLGMIFGPVVLLVLLNLAGMGMFRGARLDLEAAVRDLAAILSRRPE